MTSVAVTGAGGYIGSRLVGVLAQTGDDTVRSIVRSPAPWLAGEQAAVDLLGPAEVLAGAFSDVTTVVHLAGANEATAAADPDRALADTVVAGRRLASAAVAAGVKRIVYVSTFHIYGAAAQPGVVLTESTVPAPRSTYAVARLAVEHLLAAAVDDTVVLRLTNAVGAPAAPEVARWTLVANDLCRQGVVEGRLVLHSSGLQHRDFVALDDVCRWLAHAVRPGSVPAGTYNVGAGRTRTVKQLAGLVQDAVEARTGLRPPLDAPDHEGPVPQPYRVAVEAAARFGLSPSVTLEHAVDQTVAFCLAHRDALAAVP